MTDQTPSDNTNQDTDTDTDQERTTPEHEEDRDYIVAIEDLFRVPVREVDGPEEAKQRVLDRLGEDPFTAHDAAVVDVRLIN